MLIARRRNTLIQAPFLSLLDLYHLQGPSGSRRAKLRTPTTITVSIHPRLLPVMARVQHMRTPDIHRQAQRTIQSSVQLTVRVSCTGPQGQAMRARTRQPDAFGKTEYYTTKEPPKSNFRTVNIGPEIVSLRATTPISQ